MKGPEHDMRVYTIYGVLKVVDARPAETGLGHE